MILFLQNLLNEYTTVLKMYGFFLFMMSSPKYLALIFPIRVVLLFLS